MRKSFRRLTVALCVLTVLWTCVGCAKKATPDIAPHLIALSEAEEEPVRPIDSAQKKKGFAQITPNTTLSEQFDELLDIVRVGDVKSERYKPDFTYAFPRIEQTYNAAVHILNRYVRNDFTAFERVHAIHDWLAYYVTYDFELLESEANGAVLDGNEPSFTPEGALVDKKAVCDGISKAFMLLCGIEGIRCIRVTGSYDEGEASINHAWNKVYLENRWYNVDATMDAWHVMTDGDTRLDLLSHGYFLISDELIQEATCGRHTESGEDPFIYESNDTYPYHANEDLGIADCKMEITSQQQLNAVFSAVKASKRKIGKIEVKLNFPEYDKSNLTLTNAYVSQIRTAYKQVKDADFSLDEGRGVYPYQRYPDGVFVFLIYK